MRAALVGPIAHHREHMPGFGKLLDRQNVRDWLEGNRIRVKGGWW